MEELHAWLLDVFTTVPGQWTLATTDTSITMTNPRTGDVITATPTSDGRTELTVNRFRAVETKIGFEPMLTGKLLCKCMGLQPAVR